MLHISANSIPIAGFPYEDADDAKCYLIPGIFVNEAFL